MVAVETTPATISVVPRRKMWVPYIIIRRLKNRPGESAILDGVVTSISQDKHELRDKWALE